VAGLLVLIGAMAAARGARLLVQGLGEATALDLVRGIRAIVIAFVAGLFAVGVLSAETGFLTFGALILAEELYETGTLALIIRLGNRRTASSRPAASRTRPDDI
jgi:hypothetical protein